MKTRRVVVGIVARANWFRTRLPAAGSDRQSDDFTTSRIDTIIGAAVTSNTRLAFAPGNVFLRRREAGLPRDSVINGIANLHEAVLLDSQPGAS
jgi:hypothetical protein